MCAKSIDTKRESKKSIQDTESTYGIIFDIKRFAIHDGPGIRTTVFLKGCPLKCWWCHNPEGISEDIQFTFNSEKCIPECSLCVDECPNGALSKNDNNLVHDMKKCKNSANCEGVCPTDAIQIMGKKISVDTVMNEIEKDIPFYDESGGGVTFSGGEPLMQPFFLVKLLSRCKELGIHTAIDTSGYGSESVLNRIMPLCDLFLYDLKLFDDAKHMKYTGVSNAQIIKNIMLLSKKGVPLQARLPVIPGITDKENNLVKISEFLNSYTAVQSVSLLPFHQGAENKYHRLGIDYKMVGCAPPSKEDLKRISDLFTSKGFIVKIGG